MSIGKTQEHSGNCMQLMWGAQALYMICVILWFLVCATIVHCLSAQQSTAEHSNFYFLAAFSCGTIHILRQQKDSGLWGWDQKWHFFSDVKYCIHTYILGGCVRKSTKCADVFYGWPLYSCDNCLFEKWPMHLLNGDSIAEIPTHVIHTQIMCYCKPLP